MTAIEKLRQNAQKKAKRRAKLRAAMMKMAGVGTGRPAPYFPDRNRWRAFPTQEPMFEGQINVRRGITPQPAEIEATDARLHAKQDAADMAEVRAMQAAEQAAGAAPAAGIGVGSGAATGFGGPGGPGGAGQQSQLDAYLADLKAQDEAAFNDTQARIAELRAGHAGKYNRVMGGLDSFGTTQRMLNTERQNEARKRIRANLAAKGLSNSSDYAAWEARSARDFGLVDNDLAGKIDARRVGYDVQLTNEGLDQIERINNRPPNLPQAMEYVYKYGASGDGQGYGGIDGQAAQAPAPQVAAGRREAPQTVYPAMNAHAAAAIGRGMQGQYNPAAQAQAMFGFGGGIGMMQRPAYSDVGPVVDGGWMDDAEASLAASNKKLLGRTRKRQRDSARDARIAAARAQNEAVGANPNSFRNTAGARARRSLGDIIADQEHAKWRRKMEEEERRRLAMMR